MSMIKLLISCFLFLSIPELTSGQQRMSKKPAREPLKSGVQVVPKPSSNRVEILINGKIFTSYQYPDNLMKPVLWPVVASNQTKVTRGFPIEPQAGERIDHPHHAGLWFNHGDVNEHDFWNNSTAIGKEHKGPFGRIVHKSVRDYHSGIKEGDLTTESEWLNKDGKVMINETTRFIFEDRGTVRVITRVTQLKAGSDSILFKDNKEGVFAIRVARFLEHPSDKPEIFTDAQGRATEVPRLDNTGVTGFYRNSEGIEGDEVWGKRARWVNLMGFDGKDSTGILMLDHPGNPGYPSHWHARGYGLFSCNGLGAKVFSQGREELNFALAPGQSQTFLHRILIWCKKAPGPDAIEKEFEALKKFPIGKQE